MMSEHIVKTTDARTGYQSIKELWESISKLSSHVVDDNALVDGGVYPVSIRDRQLASIKTLVRELERHHIGEVSGDKAHKTHKINNETEGWMDLIAGKELPAKGQG